MEVLSDSNSYYRLKIYSLKESKQIFGMTKATIKWAPNKFAYNWPSLSGFVECKDLRHFSLYVSNVYLSSH